MLSVLVFAAALAAPQPAPAEVHAKSTRLSTSIVTQPESCRGGEVLQAKKRAPVTAQRLGDLPPARAERTVIRRVDGCFVPTRIDDRPRP